MPTTTERDSHAPTSVLLVFPFGLLPRAGATLLWGFFCLAAYLVAGWFLLGEVGWRTLPGVALFALASSLWPPLRLSLALQNFAEVLLVLLVGAWLMERRGRYYWTGVLLGLAALLNLWPVLLLLMPIMYRRWNIVRSALLTMVIGSVLTVHVLGPQAIADYIGPVQANERARVSNEDNLSIVGAVVRPFIGYHEGAFIIPPLVHGVSLPSAILIGELVAGWGLLATSIFLWRCLLRGGERAPRELLGQSLLITALLVIFPITWYWGLTLLLLPGAMVLLALSRLPKPPIWWWLAIQVASLFPCGAAWLCDWLANGQLEGPRNALTSWVRCSMMCRLLRCCCLLGYKDG